MHSPDLRAHTALLLLVLVSGCANSSEQNDGSLETKSLRANARIDHLASGVFVGKIADIRHSKHYWYLCDNRSHQVFVVNDTSFEEVMRLGSHGRGPGEMLYCTSLLVADDSVFVFDSGLRVINVFDASGKFQRRIQTSYLRYGFDRDEDARGFYSSVDSRAEPVVRIGMDGSIDSSFGTILQASGDSTIRRAKNNRLVRVTDEGRVVVVGATIPVVEVYDESDALRASIDLTIVPWINEAARNAAEQTGWLESGGFRYGIVFQHMAVAHGKLFLLAWQPGDLNNLLVFDIRKMAVVGFYNLLTPEGAPLDYVYTIGVDTDAKWLLAYNISDEVLYSFDIQVE